ncbi:hypothetical protein [Alistipes sp.]|uniref:hypothetical protein n=1 Tax=Alistipes sp. TaxID=1872444 RepID=UPI0025BA46E1|nr:hypothetical protein [Alistipes sp.]
MGFPTSLLKRIAQWLPQQWRKSAESRADEPDSKADSELAAEPRRGEAPLLIIPKHYAVTGHLRPRKAIPPPAESKPEDAATFVQPPAEKSASMQGWGELVLQGTIRENGETEEPREPRPALRLPSLQNNGKLHDPEVLALLRSVEAGERILAPDVTEEERREIENFDLRNYV